ncbi:TIGR03086 family metal-binding protein [Arthrobacter sp. A5]|uniref:TIGR03086 family metal-binding protein n=1 Tax=Arthrobacter sp. A5 TaxID=576926 RepID=UPI003DA81C62
MTIVSEDTLMLLERAVLQTGRIVSGVESGQTSLPTPCGNWDVGRLLQHVVGQDLHNFTVAARGETPDWAEPPQALGNAWSVDYQERAQRLLSTWREADRDAEVAGPGGRLAPLIDRADQQITELSVHAWDLARATGQGSHLDPEVAAYALAWGQRMLQPAFRGADKAFGPEVSVPDGAPVQDRLAGWFGRDPAWQPPAAR